MSRMTWRAMSWMTWRATSGRLCLAEAKVSDLDCPVAVHQNVVAVEVAVDDGVRLVLVQVQHAARDADAPLDAASQGLTHIARRVKATI